MKCDVLVAIIGQHWIELAKAKVASGERDYAREEIASALKRNIIVVPVRVGREGRLPSLPRAEDLQRTSATSFFIKSKILLTSALAAISRT